MRVPRLRPRVRVPGRTPGGSGGVAKSWLDSRAGDDSDPHAASPLPRLRRDCELEYAHPPPRRTKMVASLLFTIATFLVPAGQAKDDGETVCYAAKVGDLLALQKETAGGAARKRLASLGDDRFGLQHLLQALLRVRLEQGEGALLDPDFNRFLEESRLFGRY